MNDFIIEFIETLYQHPLFSKEGGLNVKHNQTPDSSVLMLVAGDNGSGKGIISRFFSDIANNKGYLIRNVSPIDRANRKGIKNTLSAGTSDNKDCLSTGTAVFSKLKIEIDNLKNATEPFVVIFDAPETGLSDAYMKALGQYLAESTTDLVTTGHCKGILLLSHNRKMSQSLCNFLELEPNGFHLGEGYEGYWDWLMDNEPDKSLIELLELPDKEMKMKEKVGNLLV